MSQPTRIGLSPFVTVPHRRVEQVIAPYAHLDVPVIGQAYILFRAKLLAPFHFSPGIESLETKLFAPKDIPFDEIAFSSISIVLQQYIDDLSAGKTFHLHHAVIDKQPGSRPNDPTSFVLRDHFALPTQMGVPDRKAS